MLLNIVKNGVVVNSSTDILVAKSMVVHLQADEAQWKNALGEIEVWKAEWATDDDKTRFTYKARLHQYEKGWRLMEIWFSGKWRPVVGYAGNKEQPPKKKILEGIATFLANAGMNEVPVWLVTLDWGDWTTEENQEFYGDAQMSTLLTYIAQELHNVECEVLYFPAGTYGREDIPIATRGMKAVTGRMVVAGYTYHVYQDLGAGIKGLQFERPNIIRVDLEKDIMPRVYITDTRHFIPIYEEVVG